MYIHMVVAPGRRARVGGKGAEGVDKPRVGCIAGMQSLQL